MCFLSILSDLVVRGRYIVWLSPSSRDDSNRGSSWSWSYGSWMYNYLCNQFLSPLTLWEFESRSDEVYSIQYYVIKFVSDLRQVDGFLCVFRFPPSIKLTATSGVKHHNHNSNDSNIKFYFLWLYHKLIIYKALWFYFSQTLFIYFAFQSFGFQRTWSRIYIVLLYKSLTWWRLFQKRAVRTKFEVYVMFLIQCII